MKQSEGDVNKNASPIAISVFYQNQHPAQSCEGDMIISILRYPIRGCSHSPHDSRMTSSNNIIGQEKQQKDTKQHTTIAILIIWEVGLGNRILTVCA